MKKSYFYLVLLIPLFLIVLMKLCPAPAAPVEKGMSASEERARAAEERRAERREAREARKAEKAAAKAAAAQQNMTPDFGAMSFGDFPPPFDPGMGFDNGMAMAPGGFGGGPGMGFGGGFGGPGMGFGGGFGGF